MQVSALWKTQRQKFLEKTNKNGALGTYFFHLPREVYPAAAAHCSCPSCNEFIAFKKKAKKKRRKVLQAHNPAFSVSFLLFERCNTKLVCPPQKFQERSHTILRCLQRRRVLLLFITWSHVSPKMTSESMFQNLDVEPTYGALANSSEITKKYTRLIYTCWSPWQQLKTYNSVSDGLS